MFEAASADTDPRVRKEAEALVSAGYEVIVLAWDRSGERPRHERRDGWRIENLGRAAGHGGGLRSVPGYRAYWRAASARAVELDPDVLHCHDLDTVPAALAARKRLARTPRLVLDFWELYRESRALPQRGIVGRMARWVARRLEHASIPAADLVITVVEGQVDYYRTLGAKRVIVVENAPDLDRYSPQPRDAEEFTICFIGNKRYVRGLVTLAHAIQPHPLLRALFVGGGPSAELLEEAVRGFERVDVRGRVDNADIPELYHECDAVFATYDTSLLNWRTAFPVKVQEGMASGLPVIVSKGTWVEEYVERHGLGYAVDDRDMKSVERAVLALADDRTAAREMGARGRALVERELNWGAAAQRLLDGYAAVFSAGDGGRVES